MSTPTNETSRDPPQEKAGAATDRRPAGRSIVASLAVGAVAALVLLAPSGSGSRR